MCCHSICICIPSSSFEMNLKWNFESQKTTEISNRRPQDLQEVVVDTSERLSDLISKGPFRMDFVRPNGWEKRLPRKREFFRKAWNKWVFSGGEWKYETNFGCFSFYWDIFPPTWRIIPVNHWLVTPMYKPWMAIWKGNNMEQPYLGDLLTK